MDVPFSLSAVFIADDDLALRRMIPTASDAWDFVLTPAEVGYYKAIVATVVLRGRMIEQCISFIFDEGPMHWR